MHEFSSSAASYKALFQSFQENSAGNQVSQYTLEDTIKHRQVLRRLLVDKCWNQTHVQPACFMNLIIKILMKKKATKRNT